MGSIMDILDFLRQFRIGPFAIFDTALAYVGIFLLAPVLTKLFYRFHFNISRTAWLWLTLPISVIFHFVFRQSTPFMKMFLDPNGFYIAKIILLFMLYMGLRNIRIIKKI
jgi:ABC-type enterochelin transport system permease subunit